MDEPVLNRDYLVLICILRKGWPAILTEHHPLKMGAVVSAANNLVRAFIIKIIHGG
jgi:hypothetical protein